MRRVTSSARCALALVAVLVGCAGSDPASPVRIVCLGDSITLGTTRGGELDGHDAKGGYVGRLRAHLGPAAEVIGRAFGGATAAMWLAAASSPYGAPFVQALRQIGPPIEVSPPTRVVDAVVRTDRPAVVVVFLGTNDLLVAREPDAVGGTMRDLHAVHDAAASGGARVLMATVLPTRRVNAAVRDALNARIHAEFDDVVPFGERFAAADWEHLLADVVHPNEDGYELLAGVLADELRRRHLVASR
jgi:lysophospholipase L1-like esterase